MAYIAQSATAALNPRIPLGKQILESLQVHGKFGVNSRHDRLMELMALMHLPDPEQMVERYPPPSKRWATPTYHGRDGDGLHTGFLDS